MQLDDLKQIAKRFEDKLSKIKVAAFDVDGVLTNGQLIWMGQEIGWNRIFHTSDGYGLKLLMKNGIKTGVISGGHSHGLSERIQGLNLDFSYLGNEDKIEAFEDLLTQGFKEDEILYMGDEFFDIPLLKRVGFSVSVPHASLEIRDTVDFVTRREGGHGAVREVIDILRYAKHFPNPF
ncbi:MAG: HAD hydrolase family protein [Halobacteriovoraceae bacterium]|nr:HAD hydrolase family protein [Halobacteriovoraceae bacterium]